MRKLDGEDLTDGLKYIGFSILMILAFFLIAGIIGCVASFMLSLLV